MAERVKGATIAALARTAPGDVDRAAEALAPARRARLHTFIATSPIHMEHKLRMTPAEVLAAAEGAVARAKGYTDDVEFSAEDATRSDPEFLKQVLRGRHLGRGDHLNVPDTVGYMLPDDSPSWSTADRRDSRAPTGPSGASTATTTWASRPPLHLGRAWPGPARSSAPSTASASGPATARWRRW